MQPPQQPPPGLQLPPPFVLRFPSGCQRRDTPRVSCKPIASSFRAPVLGWVVSGERTPRVTCNRDNNHRRARGFLLSCVSRRCRRERRRRCHAPFGGPTWPCLGVLERQTWAGPVRCMAHGGRGSTRQPPPLGRPVSGARPTCVNDKKGQDHNTSQQRKAGEGGVANGILHASSRQQPLQT